MAFLSIQTDTWLRACHSFTETCFSLRGLSATLTSISLSLSPTVKMQKDAMETTLNLSSSDLAIHYLTAVHCLKQHCWLPDREQWSIESKYNKPWIFRPNVTFKAKKGAQNIIQKYSMQNSFPFVLSRVCNLPLRWSTVILARLWRWLQTLQSASSIIRRTEQPVVKLCCEVQRTGQKPYFEG